MLTAEPSADHTVPRRYGEIPGRRCRRPAGPHPYPVLPRTASLDTERGTRAQEIPVGTWGYTAAIGIEGIEKALVMSRRSAAKTSSVP